MVKPEKPQEKTVSVTLDARLLELAREAEIDLSATLRAALIGEVNAFAIERWKNTNRAGLLELNRITQELGLLSDEYKTF
ncbi:type II toxin-antitoxin system CcdA family antitoxin [Pluralibacter gergoviae]